MKKRAAKITALALAAAMALTACGGGNDAGSTGTAGSTTGEAQSGTENAQAIQDLVTYETPNREQESFFILNSEKAQDLNVLCNMYSPLLEVDPNGKLIPAVAKEWGTEDGGLTWTFKLRDDVKWVDINGNEKAACTAQDWITAMEWVLNFHKNGSQNTSMPLALIAGAQDYYNYTKDLDPAEAMALDTSKMLEMVGIEAPDDYTLVYHCAMNAPYFDTVCTSACMYPISQGLIDELGVENMVGMTNENMWYNGPYFETTFTMNNEKVLTKNPTYWDKDAQLFETVTIRMVEPSMQYQLWQNGELDNIGLAEADLRTIYDDESNPWHKNLVETRPKKYSYQMHLNYDKMKEDGTPDENWNKAVANEAFRLSWYYGLELNRYWSRTNFIYPLHCENVGYTMKGLLYFSDGTDYADRVEEKLGLPESDGKVGRRYDKEKAEAYKKQAMEELSAKGVTFPVNVDYYIISGNQDALDKATVLKQTFAESLGEDFVNLNIKTYVSSLSKEVVQPGLASFHISGWGADYGDPANFLDQERYGYDSAYYSMNYSRINNATDEDLIATYKEFSDMTEKAGQIYDDMDARYEAYADAEVFLLNHALTIPMEYEIQWQLSKINDYSKMNAMYGAQNYTYKNWTTSVDAYTTEQYESFKAESEAK